MQTFQISIPKPCHEDWSKMTTEERGRFCGVCNKTVIDFSKKSDTEIQQLLFEKQKEKMCGHFRSDQIAPPVKVEIPLNAFHQRLKPMQAFAFAILLVFGTSLFSCTDDKNNVVGEIAIANNDTSYQNKLNITLTRITGAMITPIVTEEFIKGDTISSLSDTSELPDSVIKNSLSKAIDTVDIDTVDAITTKLNDILCRTIGMMSFTVIENQPGIFNDDTSNTENKIETLTDLNIFSETHYPNPTNGLVTIELNLQVVQNVQIDLYDLNGKLIRNVIPNQTMQAEFKSIQLNVSEQPAGIYLLRTIVGDKIKTERIVLNK